MSKLFMTSDGAVVEVDLGSGQYRELPAETPINGARGLAVDAQGAVIVVDGLFLPEGTPARGAVLRVDPATGSRTTVTVGGALTDAHWVGVEPAGTILVHNGPLDESDSIIRVDPVTGHQDTLAVADPAQELMALAIERDGGILVADGSSQAIFRVDPRTGKQKRLTAKNAFSFVSGLAVEADGRIIATDQLGTEHYGSVFRIDPSDGSLTLLTRDGYVGGPVGLVIDGDGSVVVSVHDCRPDDEVNAIGLVRVDPASGEQARIIAFDPEFESSLQIAIGQPPG